MIKQLINAFKNSVYGFKYLFQERAFLQEIAVLPVLVIVLAVCDTSVFMRMYCIFSYAVLLIVEALNTGIETVVDRISMKQHELSKKAKDIGSAAVCIAILHLILVMICVICCR